MRFLWAQIAGFLIFFSTMKCRIMDCKCGPKKGGEKRRGAAEGSGEKGGTRNEKEGKGERT